MIVQPVPDHPALNLNLLVLPAALWVFVVEAAVLVVQFHAVHRAQHAPLPDFSSRRLGHNCQLSATLAFTAGGRPEKAR